MVGTEGEVGLVGRERELAVLRAALDDAVGGRPGGVVVAGEAGGGKSRLVRELLGGPTARRAVVLRAQCVDLGDPGLPHLVTADLVRAVERLAADDADVAAVRDGLPVLAGLTRPGAAEEDVAADGAGRPRLLEATVALLAGVAQLRGPVVVVVEDAQWVDASSAGLLRFLLTRLGGERLLVVVTVRTDGMAARPQLRRLLGELDRLPAVRRLDLPPFDDGEVAAYLREAGVADDVVGSAAEVRRRTGGNPYYVQVLAAGLARTGSLDDGVPPALADLLLARVDALPDDARTVLRCAAVAGPTATDRLLRRVSGLPDPALDAALRALVADGMVRPEPGGYAFTHDLLRSAVLDDLLPGERSRLHAVHADALVARAAGPPRPAEVAHHLAWADDVPGTLEWSMRAAEEAMRDLAPEEAVAHYGAVLERWAEVPDAAARAGTSEGRVAVRAARAAGLAGEPEAGATWARRAIELCDAADDARGGVEARVELVRQLLVLDTAEQAVAPAEEAVRRADAAGVDTATSASAHVALARALVLTRRTQRLRAQVDRALAGARASGDPGLEVEALAVAGFVEESEGDREAAAATLGEALALARAEGVLAAELRAHYALASLHYYAGDVAGALPVLEAAMRRVADRGLRWSGPGVELRLLQAVALYVSGDLDGSLAVAATADARPPDVAAARLGAVGCYAAVARGLGDVESRFASLRGSWELDPQVGLVAGGCEAEWLAWSGDPAAAGAAAERTQAFLDAVAGEGMYAGLWLSAVGLSTTADQAEACRRTRDPAGEAAALARGDELATRVSRLLEAGHGRPGELGPEGRAWQLRAVAEHARLRGEPGVAEWRAALAAYGYGNVYEQARCRWRLAEALVAAGDRDAARTHAAQAADAARHMGAEPLQQAVAATVARAGLSTGAGGADAVLTGREREVLALVAEGLTNREVGRRLFISEKTVSVHLSNLMAKLHASSRTEAVTVAHRRGLLDVL